MPKILKIFLWFEDPKSLQLYTVLVIMKLQIKPVINKIFMIVFSTFVLPKTILVTDRIWYCIYARI